MKNYSFTLYAVLIFCLAFIESKASGLLTPGYVKNQGQVEDQDHKPLKDVLYMYVTQDFKLVLRKTGFSYELDQRVPVAGQNNESDNRPLGLNEDDDNDLPVVLTTNRVDVDFVNPQDEISVTAEGESPYYFNYYNVSNPVSFVHEYQTVYYHNVYKGVDLVFTLMGESHQPEYRWIIHPNGNAKDISLSYQGQKKLSLDSNGSLKVLRNIGNITEQHPVLVFHDGRHSGKATFHINRNIVSLRNIPRSHQDIIVDPAISWALYYGGTNTEYPDDLIVHTESSGTEYVYVCGRTKSDANIFYTGGKDGIFSSPGYDDAFLAKFNSATESGTNTSDVVIWATYYGGSYNDKALAIPADTKSDGVFIAGKTESADGIIYSSDIYNHIPYDDTYNGVSGGGGSLDGFIAKFDKDGEYINATYVGGNKDDYFLGLAVEADNGNDSDDKLDGNVYGSGSTESLNLGTSGVEQSSYSGGDGDHGDIMLVKLDNVLEEKTWFTYYGKLNGQERGHAVTTDRNGNIFQTGTIEFTSDGVGGLQKGNYFQGSQGSSDPDVFIAKWTKDGKIDVASNCWFTFYGGAGIERGRNIKTDDAGNVYCVGQTTSYCSAGNFCASQMTAGSSTPMIKSNLDNLGAPKDGYIVKFDTYGNRIWGTYFGGSSNEEMRALYVNPLGAPIYVGGFTTSGDFPLVDPDDNTFVLGEYFVSKINYTGTAILYSTFFGGNGYDGTTSSSGGPTGAADSYNCNLEVNSKGDIYFANATTSTTGISTNVPSGFTTLDGGYDAFVAKITDACGANSDAFEPNGNVDGSAPQIPFPDSKSIILKALIGAASDVDVFSFVMPAGNTHVRIDLSSLPPSENYDVYLYNSGGGASIAQGTSAGAGADEHINKTGLTAGALYYVKVIGSNSSNDYSATDCYQLKITAATTKEAEPVEIVSDNILSMSIEPNPAREETNLSIYTKIENRVTLVIYDLTGRLIYQNNYSLTTGENRFSLDLNKFSAGDYTIRINTGSEQRVKKLSVIK